ncbi:sensor histidine kinase [Salsipaludibacter albus]|uniref:sensor histidine kinase n=1 Tax=Salsipaludibacter albus TaxID=2849650 RepID=UPI001EE4616E|nr:sensor histidine kinase [Salsipaludibacter albus]MBY5162388.1 sensor histidine kinase [Salsipaludibacter albus]
MTTIDTDRLTQSTAWLGIGTTLAVAIPVVVAQLAGDVHELLRSPVGWWTAYLVFVAVLVADVRGWAGSQTTTGQRIVVAIMAVSGLVAVAMSPAYGFSVVLPIVTATAATFVIGFRPALVLTAGQAVLIMLVYVAVPGVGVGDAVLQGVAWGGFMGFAVFTVEVGAREGRAREHLAVLNDELAETNARLARTNVELEEAQRQLAVQSRTAERLRISRDLHDLIGHQLTALSLQLEAAGHRGAGAATDNVERSRAIARDLLGDVRDVVGRLREDGAHDDLAAALRDAATVAGPMAVELEVDDDALPTDAERATTVLRVVQESVTNAVRHADARNLWIRVGEAGSGVVVEVRDDGRGSPDLVPGHGLTGMRERVEAVGGTVETSTSAGGGFHLRASLPGPARP